MAAGARVGTAWYSLEASDAKLKKALNNADGQITKTGTNAEKMFAGRMSNAAAAFGQAVKKAAVIGVAALGAGLVLAVTRAAAFEKAMLNVNSIAKLSAKDFDAMKDQVVDLSLELPQSAEILAEGLYQIQSSGFAGAEGIDVLEAAAKAASAGLTTTEVAATGLTGILNAYGFKAEDAGRISDVMFKTVDRGVISFEELSSQIGNVTSIAAPLGVGVEEIGAALAVMTRSGVDAARSTTGVRAVLSSLLAPSVQAKAVAKELGIEWNAGALKANGLAGMMEILMEATGGNEEQMAKLLGTQEGIGAAMLLGKDGAAEFTAEIDLMKDSVGATDTALSYQKQGLAYNLQLLKNNLDAAAISIGTALLPALVPLVTELGKWLSANQDLIGQIADMVASGFATFVQTVGDFAAVAINVGTAVVGWVEANRELITQVLTLGSSVVVNGIQGLVDVLLWVGSNDVTLALGIATAAVLGVVTALGLLVAHPVIGGLALIVVAIGLLKTAWEENWGGIRDVIIDSWPVIHGVLDDIYGGVQVFGRLLNGVALGIALLWTEMVGAVVRGAEVVLGAMASVPGPFQEDAQKAHAALMGLANGTEAEADRIEAQITDMANAPLDHLPKWRLGVGGFAPALEGQYANVWRAGEQIGSAVRSTTDINLFASGNRTGKSWADGLWASASYARAASWEVAMAGGSALVAYSPPKEGPLRSIDDNGLNVGLTWARGLLGARGEARHNSYAVALAAAAGLNGVGSSPLASMGGLGTPGMAPIAGGSGSGAINVVFNYQPQLSTASPIELEHLRRVVTDGVAESLERRGRIDRASPHRY